MNEQLLTQFIQALTGLYHPDPLGAVARGNSRAGGLTPQANWDAMFTPTSDARQAQMTNHPMATVAERMNAPGNFDPAQQAWDAGHGPLTPALQQLGKPAFQLPHSASVPYAMPVGGGQQQAQNPLAALFGNWF